MVDNVMLEDSEKFIVSIDPLSLPYGVVLGDVPTAEVVILDDDGKCIGSYIYNNYIIVCMLIIRINKYVATSLCRVNYCTAQNFDKGKY